MKDLGTIAQHMQCNTDSAYKPKQCNFSDHVMKCFSSERSKWVKTLLTIVRGIHQKLENQLAIKFQFAHLTAIHGKPFNLYSDRANLRKGMHNADLGNK